VVTDEAKATFAADGITQEKAKSTIIKLNELVLGNLEEGSDDGGVNPRQKKKKEAPSADVGWAGNLDYLRPGSLPAT
jgi:hypothetical protein